MIFGGETTQKRGVEKQGVIPIVGEVFGLERDCGIVIVEENGVPRFEDGAGLAVDAGGIEEKGGARGSFDFDDAGGGKGFDLREPPVAGLIFAVGAAYVAKGSGTDIGEVKAELDLARNTGNRLLVVPGVAMPAVEAA